MLKICLAQMEIIPGHPDKNTTTMLSMIAEAKKQQSDLIIFPEMAIPGYLLGDTWEEDSFLRDCLAYGEDIIAASENIAIMFGNVAVDWRKKNTDGRVRKYNAFYTAQHGTLVQPEKMPYPFAIKTLLPNYREFDDSRYFCSLTKFAAELNTTAEELLSPVTLKINGKNYTIGCLLCEDSWSDDYTLKPLEILAAKYQLSLMVNISSSPYTLGKNNKRHRVFGQHTADTKIPLVYVNNVGLQNNGKTIYTFDGCSTVYRTDGKPALTAKAFAPAAQSFVLEELDTMTAEPAMKKEDTTADIFAALTYGVRHFLRDIHMERVVIGISGGIDSAVAAALYTYVLGRDKVLLINMPSVYNSSITKGLAQQLALNLGCHYAIAPIQESVDLTIKQIENTPLTESINKTSQQLHVSSFVAENIQARDRSARVLAGFAAAFGAGFTCNANKAETTVGYSTLYGDQSGFLAALADLWKHQVYDLARYMNTMVYGREVIPQETIDIVPSAELSSAQNVAEGKGDPIIYPYHDYLFRSFVESWSKTGPEDILRWYQDGSLEERLGCEKGIVAKTFPDAAAFIADLERWWNLFRGMAVAKRIQAPPILAISRRAYGFDHREAQNGAYYTREYHILKQSLLNV